MRLIRLTREAYDEYHCKRREMVALKRAGADHAEVAYLRKELRQWAIDQVAAERAGAWYVDFV